MFRPVPGSHAQRKNVPASQPGRQEAGASLGNNLDRTAPLQGTLDRTVPVAFGPPRPVSDAGEAKVATRLRPAGDFSLDTPNADEYAVRNVPATHKHRPLWRVC